MKKNNLEEKIKALSLKTVANGASPSEAAAARQMIARLTGRPVKDEEPASSTSTKTTDDLARIALRGVYYDDYLRRTHSTWENYNKTKLGIETYTRISREQYEERCKEVYETIKLEMEEDDARRSNRFRR